MGRSRDVKLTLPILILPLVILYCCWVSTYTMHVVLRTVPSYLWLLSLLICLIRGVYILDRSRFVGSLCVGLPVIQLLAVLLPHISR
jgi:lipid-A-disaccharide synthase-like uncharacterized protein